MDGLRNRKKRLMFSIVTGMLAAMFLSGPVSGIERKGILAWWGTLYPQFCFEEAEEDPDNYENTAKQPPKLSFWLAKALERW